MHPLLDLGDPRYAGGALICLLALAMLGWLASRPLPPPGTPWPRPWRRPTRLRPTRIYGDSRDIQGQVVDAELIDNTTWVADPTRVDPSVGYEERIAAWELSRRRHPSYPRAGDDLVRRDDP